MPLPSLSALQAFEAVYRHGSVTRAARELHLTQSAVSHRLRALEDELGVELLVREGRGVRVTARGAQFAGAIAEALSTLESAVAALTPRRAARTALSVSCSSSFAIRFLVPRLATFREGYPEVDLRVSADDSPVHPARAGVDAGVRLASGAVAGLRCEKLSEEIVFPVLSPRLLEAGARPASPRALLSFPLLHDEALAHEPGRVGWAAWFARNGVRTAEANRGVRFSHAYLAIEAALAGDGVALARRSLVADDLARGRLVAVGPSVASGLSYWLVTALERETSPALEGFRAFLMESLRDAARVADRHLPRERSATGAPAARPSQRGDKRSHRERKRRPRG